MKKKLTVDNGQRTAKGKGGSRRRDEATMATTRRKSEKAKLHNPQSAPGAPGRNPQSPIPAALAGLAVPIGQLHPDPENVRLHPERNIEAIMASLSKFGQQAPAVYVLRKGNARELPRKIIIKGNGVLAAATALGWTHLAAVRSGLQGREAQAFAIADNRTTDLSEFDEELLAVQLRELEEADYDLASIGYTDAEFQELFKDATSEAEDGEGNEGETASRKRGERTAVIIVGHLKFELPRVEFDRWLAAVEAKVGNDPDRVVREIKRRLGLAKA